MSRRLAIAVAMIPVYTKASTAEDKNIPAPHLIAVDQDTGKALVLNLNWQVEWRELPAIPLHLLDKGNVRQSDVPFEEARRRTLDSDLSEDRG